MGRWQNSDEDKYLSFRACMKLAQDATLSKLWINIGHDWFTPEEFRVLAEKKVIKHSVGDQTSLKIKEVKIKDPRTIPDRMQTKIDEMVQKKIEFEMRIKQYYRIV